MNAAHVCAVDETLSCHNVKKKKCVLLFFSSKPLSTAALFLKSHIPEAGHHLLSQAQVGELSGP